MAGGLPALTLVIGGAASGKSVFAEGLIAASGRSPVYVATAEAGDAEMHARIAAHRDRRGPKWRTLEEPRAPWQVLAGLGAAEAVLLDCATLWLSNALLAGADWEAEAGTLIATAVATPAPVVVVSNEVGLGLVPETALGRAFRDAQGHLNQRLAHSAGLVVFVAAGLPLVLKGRLPAQSA